MTLILPVHVLLRARDCCWWWICSGALTIGRRRSSCPCRAMMLRPTSPHSRLR